MTLLAATTVQRGTVMIIVARFVFRAAVDQTAGASEED